jgi:gas vesicle protein
MAYKKKIIGGAVIGIAAGYLVGLLTAPTSGKRSRKRIKKAANQSMGQFEKQLKSIFRDSQELIVKVKKAHPKIDDKLKTSIQKVETSQSKIKDILTSIHGNDNVDEDLTKAISDAKEALKHLKSFVTK